MPALCWVMVVCRQKWIMTDWQLQVRDGSGQRFQGAALICASVKGLVCTACRRACASLTGLRCSGTTACGMSSRHRITTLNCIGVVSCSGAVVAQRLRTAVFEQLEFTASAGIACNKLLAKIGSARNKPNKQTLVLPRAVEDLMRVRASHWQHTAARTQCPLQRLYTRLGAANLASSSGQYLGLFLHYQLHAGHGVQPATHACHGVLRDGACLHSNGCPFCRGSSRTSPLAR
eukprot:GHUV01024528.1.p1 GENE.GHUV01024528.1~~GHUV01024528.1.p1  ORF type:complete len:232 (-),score=42.26 GHUV01024528.1:129-824(-)